MSYDFRSHYINKIKKLTSFLNNDIDDSSKVRELESFVKRLRIDIEQNHSGYYIAEYDADNFIRCYEPLGFMTQFDALEQLSDMKKSRSGYIAIREVTEEEWGNFIRLKYLTIILTMSNSEHVKGYDDITEDVINSIPIKIKKLRKKLGLKYWWQVIA